MKNKTIKCLIVGLSLLLCVTMAFGCSKKKEDEEVVARATAKPEPDNLIGQITLSGYVFDEKDSHLDDYIQEFNTQYNNVEVSVLHDDLGADAYFSELDDRIETGTIGDVFLIDDARLAKYASEGKIIDLSKYIETYIDYDSGEKIDPQKELFPAAYNSSLYDGDMYMGPLEYYHNFIFVNYSILQKAGLNAPLDTWNWAELISDCDVISKKCGIAQPLAMNYNDYEIWGAFARSRGADIYDNIGNTEKKGMNLTNPKVIDGFKDLCSIIKTNLVASVSADDISAEDLSKYAFIVADQTNVAEWTAFLTSDKCDFEWDYMHFPRWVLEDQIITDEEGNESFAFYQSIGAKSYGLAVLNRGNSDEYNDEYYRMCAELALYGLVDDAAEKYAGKGEVVPANIEVNAQRFWRDYPVKGKNSSVFSHYSDKADFSVSLTSFMSKDSAKEFNVAEIIQKYISGNIPFEDTLQDLQNRVNASWH